MSDILFLHYGRSPFVERDRKYLSADFSASSYVFRLSPLLFVLDVVGFLVGLIPAKRRPRVLLTRFADYHAAAGAFASRLYGIPLILVVGGYDAVWIERLAYGVYRKGKSRAAARYALRNATMILPVHESLVQGENGFDDDPPRREGILEFTPEVAPRIRVVHNGYEPAEWFPTQDVQRPRDFLTVAAVTSRTAYLIKGVDSFAALARRMKDRSFTLIGMESDVFLRLDGGPRPDNLEILPPMTATDIRKEYSRTKVYVQLSLSEGMPNALCEAMLCGCIPVGSAVNGIPMIIGDTGEVVHKKDLTSMEHALDRALRSGSGDRARARIEHEFSADKRRRRLKEIISEVMGAPEAAG